jgi:ubiquinone biosynthesis protein
MSWATNWPQQLKYLQDKLPPFPGRAIAKKMIEAELELPVDQAFSEFSEPVAAASIAQVHRARLADTGEEVAVKVLRPASSAPSARTSTPSTCRPMDRTLARFSRRLRPMDVITHFEGVVMGELDLRLESSAAAEFAANTAKDEGFQVPKPSGSCRARNVMTLGWAEGMSMNDNAAIDAAGHDRACWRAGAAAVPEPRAARRLFHADMHQGNLKVAANGDIIAYDFGIMGRIDEYTRRVYAEILFGFIRKDYRRVAEVHFEAGYVPADRDIDEFARALRRWASRSSAWTPAASRWRGCWPICSR